MSSNQPTLHLVCGKIAAGKSTLTAELGQRVRTIVIAEDQWLSQLYPGEQKTLADYVRNSSRLRGVMGPHVVALLRAGVSVVLDFPANTLASRAWAWPVRSGRRAAPTAPSRRAGRDLQGAAAPA